jgi:hypothetical protein
MSVDELTTLAKGLASLAKATQDYEGENKETASR